MNKEWQKEFNRRYKIWADKFLRFYWQNQEPHYHGIEFDRIFIDDLNNMPDKDTQKLLDKCNKIVDEIKDILDD